MSSRESSWKLAAVDGGPGVDAGQGDEVPSFARQRLWFLEQLGGSESTYHVSARLRLDAHLLDPSPADAAPGIDPAVLAALPPVAAIPGDGLALSFPQQRLWLLEQLGGVNGTYNLRRRLRLEGELDRAALLRALARIVARHDALRTTFVARDGEPQPRVAPEDSGFALIDHDVSGEADQDAALRRIASDEADAPFDLAGGPLVRGRLVRLAADDHVLFVTMHGMVADGWSMGVFFHELGVLYGAFRRGEPDPLPALGMQYADYAASQRRGANGGGAQGDYWTRTLAGAPELLELPVDHPRAPLPDHAGAGIALELDEALTAGLHALGRRHGAALSTTLLAGWATVLGRLAGQDDVVIGTPTANRGAAGTEGLIGSFTNTLALRVDLAGSPTVAELLGRVQARVEEAERNGALPFERVLELVQPGRTVAPTPLFQVAFAWHDAHGSGLALPGLDPGAAGPEPHAAAKFDLSLELREREGRVVGGLTYATALFDAETAERYAGYLRRVLHAMVADDARPVARLALPCADERRRVLEDWNRTGAPYPETCLHEQFEAQAARTPDAVAVVFEDRRLTYAELNGRANRLAHELRARGVGPDARVGICVDRGVEVVVGLLGVLKAGGAYLPLDPSYPEERLAYMVRDSAPAVLLTHGSAAGRLADLGLPVVTLDEDAEWWARQPDGNPPRGATPENLAYVIYTSGSTGRPKGVQLVHRAVSNLVHWYRGATRVSERDAVLIVTSFSFHLTQRNFLAPLFAGGQVHLTREPFEPARLAAQIAASGITMMSITPTAFQALVEADHGNAVGGMRIVVFGGEAVYPRQIAGVPEPRPEYLNVYGPTEGTGVVAAHPIRPDLDGYDGDRPLPVGRPIPNARLYALDALGEPAPIGVAGELYIGGVGVTRGYRGSPAQTAERFLPDPFGGEPGARLYRTGDLGRWLADGTAEYLGRNDQQVKVRGFRIELGEVEARLAEHAAVREAVVVAREDAPGDLRLVAYYVGEGVEVETLRAHLAERLPEYMVPAAYVRLPALPLTLNGKLDRRALPEPGGDAYARQGYEAPRGATETALVEAWSELLGVERVGRHDNFFDLGGQSLLAVRLTSRVRQALGVDVALADLFLRPVLADFARGIESAARAELPAIEPVARDGAPALSFAQQRLWFLEQLGGLGSTYHMGRRLRMHGPLSREALVRALDGLVARHEVLRTAFPTVDGEPEQHVAPAAGSRFHLVDHDLSGVADAEAELVRLAAAEAEAEFDLARGPLVRGRLVRLGMDDHALLVTLHHIVSDGWSMGVFVRELGELYGAFARGEADPLPALPVQYADYAAWQRRWVAGDVLRRQGDYWRQALSGAPELLELSADQPRPTQQDFTGAVATLELDEALTAGLKALGRRHGATLFMTLLAGWAAVLSRLSAQDDVVIGTPTANRGRAEIEGLIGFFVNMLPLRVELDGAPTVAELLGRVKARALVAQQHQDIPFEQLVEIVRPARSLTHTPLFQVMFAWQNNPAEHLEMPGLALGPVGGESHETAKFDLTLWLQEEDGRIAGGITYATALFERSTVERHLAYLHRVLEEMAADDQVQVRRLEILPAAERRLVVEDWNALAVDYAREAFVHELFEAQAARTPGAEAVEFEAETLTYAALNARANRLAHHLRALGVGPEARVAVCLERGVEMLVAVLAVLKAGG
ncbi:MAG TPA: amino acid adenylation domain-containing protein, partial [Longimicrobium sp.]|nr:amino acid adenylation domain-containing protein [Longimicrobium sp.]